MKEIKDYTKLFKVGDTVYHYSLGKCEVCEIFEDSDYPMSIKYSHKLSGATYSMHVNREYIASLSFAPYDFDNLDKFTRNRPIKDKTVVFVKTSKRSIWHIRRTYGNNPIVTDEYGNTFMRCYFYQNLNDIEKTLANYIDYPVWSFDMPDFDEEDNQQGILK